LFEAVSDRRGRETVENTNEQSTLISKQTPQEKNFKRIFNKDKEEVWRREENEKKKKIRAALSKKLQYWSNYPTIQQRARETRR